MTDITIPLERIHFNPNDSIFIMHRIKIENKTIHLSHTRFNITHIIYININIIIIIFPISVLPRRCSMTCRTIYVSMCMHIAYTYSLKQLHDSNH